MTRRYTYKQLLADVAEMNNELEKAGADMFMEAGGRNGYTAIDVLDAKQRAWRKGDRTQGGSGVARSLICGTPRECLQEARTFYWQQLAAVKKEG